MFAFPNELVNPIASRTQPLAATTPSMSSILNCWEASLPNTPDNDCTHAPSQILTLKYSSGSHYLHLTQSMIPTVIETSVQRLSSQLLILIRLRLDDFPLLNRR